MNSTRSHTYFAGALILAGLLLAACGGTAAPATATASPRPPTATASETSTVTPSPTDTETATPTPSDTPTPSVTPTWAVLRGRVNVAKLSCRFGPGAMYLYKYGLLETAAVEIIGRVDTGHWVLTQPPGGTGRCWVNSDYLDFDGDVLAVEPVDVHSSFVWSPYYGPLTGVHATRDGNTVTVTWNPLVLIAGDDSEQTPYVLEAWVCMDGEVTFNPVGSYYTSAEVIDEPGCDEPSYLRVLAAEKHGYTVPTEVEVPPFEDAEPSPTP